MRKLLILNILPLFLGAAGANAAPSLCDSVLIPSTVSFEHNTRTFLTTLSLIDDAQSLSNTDKQKFDLTVPILGAPVDFGYKDATSSDFRKRTISYFNQNFSRDDNVSYLTSTINKASTDAWVKCIMDHAEFQAYFNKEAVFPDRATLFVSRFKTGRPPPTSQLRIHVDGGTIQDPVTHNYVPDLEINDFDVVGHTFFLIRRDPGKRVTIQSSMDNLPIQTSTIQEETEPWKIPKVQIRVHGNLQKAAVDQTFAVGQFNVNIQAPNGILFNSNNVQLTIEELVDGKVCEDKIISSSALGDSMDSHPEWQLDHMKAGCNVIVNPPGIGHFVQCFVDPRYFTECGSQ